MKLPRTSAVQLPDLAELQEIIDKEAKRPIPNGKENSHYAQFESVAAWMKAIGVSAELFDDDARWQDVITEGALIEPEVVAKTLALEESQRGVLVPAAEYLGKQDVLQASDLIYVFGSRSPTRGEKAAELYKAGIAPRIFITGGNPNYKPGESSEADFLKQVCVSKGVPESAILTQGNTITLADCTRGGLNFLDEHGLSPTTRLIIVSAWFALQRSYAHLMKYVDPAVEVLRAAAFSDPKSDFSRERWMQNEAGIRVVFNEFVKLRTAVALNTA